MTCVGRVGEGEGVRVTNLEDESNCVAAWFALEVMAQSGGEE